MMTEVLFDKKVTCLCCQNEFATKKVRNSKIMVRKKDSDFCTYYERENPYFYDVMLCPQCSFAFTEGFSPIKPEQLSVLKKEYLDKIGRIDLCNERNLQDALRLYKLALLCASLKDESFTTIAGLCMRIAWLYRYQDNSHEEEKYLAKALKYYQASYESPANDSIMGEEKILYMIGELNGRLGNYLDTRKWFNLLLSKKNLEPALKNLARDQWAEYKSILTARA